MTIVFGIIIAVTVGAGVAAMAMRHLVHCALCLALSLAGLAALYLRLHAEFVGFAQVLVYVGAVAILIVFAVFLTRGMEASLRVTLSPGWGTGIGVAGVVLALLTGAVITSGVLVPGRQSPVEATVRQIGDQLMTRYVLPLQITGLLLTAALIGAIVLAMAERRGK